MMYYWLNTDPYLSSPSVVLPSVVFIETMRSNNILALAINTLVCTAYVAHDFRSHPTTMSKHIHNSFNPKRPNENVPSGAAETAAGNLFYIIINISSSDS